MTDEMRQAKTAVKSLTERGEKEIFIDKCDLSEQDIEILKRVWLNRQSRVKIAREMHMSKESVQLHYREAMLVLCDTIRKYKAF